MVFPGQSSKNPPDSLTKHCSQVHYSNEPCPPLFSVDETPSKCSLGERKALFHHTITVNKEAKVGTQDRSLEVLEGPLLTGFLSMACSVYFLMQVRTTFPGMTQHTVGWAFPH